jgi:mannose-1-phosphate guanylyltransferase
VADENGKIERFVEKPAVFISNKINAGLYLFNTSIIDRIESKPTSIEREIFPVMADQGQIYQLALPGYWMDIGQPKDYLAG